MEPRAGKKKRQRWRVLAWRADSFGGYSLSTMAVEMLVGLPR